MPCWTRPCVVPPCLAEHGFAHPEHRACVFHRCQREREDTRGPGEPARSQASQQHLKTLLSCRRRWCGILTRSLCVFAFLPEADMVLTSLDLTKTEAHQVYTGQGEPTEVDISRLCSKSKSNQLIPSTSVTVELANGTRGFFFSPLRFQPHCSLT